MTLLTPTVDAAGTVDTTGLREAFGRFPSGVTAVCALDDDRTPIGLAASSFVAVSLDPPLVAVCIQHTSTTWPRLGARRRLGLSVLGEHQDLAARALASRSEDRFAALSWHSTDHGAVLLHGATAWLDCTLERSVRAGDHDLVLFRVRRQCTHRAQGPLVFHASAFHGLAALERAS